jgi:phage portal protein BeeE
MKSKTNKWVCVITTNKIECFNQEFKSLEDIAKEIGLSKHIIFDIANNRRTAKKYENCRFFPMISITRLP